MINLSQLEQRLRAFVAAAVARVAYWGPVSLSTSDGKSDGIGGLPSDVDSQRAARRVQHAGFRSRPPKGSMSLGIAQHGDGSTLLLVAEDDGATVALEEGEAQAYSPAQPSCRIWFDKDGALHIASNTGKDITIDPGTGGSVKVTGTAITMQPATAAAVVPVLLFGSTDSWGVPVTQLPTASGQVKGG